MSSTDLTATLAESSRGNGQAAETLLRAVYDELRQMAAARMHAERPGHLLEPTALVHEAYLKLVDQTRVDWQGRTHFQAVAAEAMRRVLIDHARSENREKRGGEWRRVSLFDAFALVRDRRIDALALHEALDRMRELDQRQSEIMAMRLLGGLSVEDVARLLDISERTVNRDWKMGLAWLRRELSKG